MFKVTSIECVVCVISVLVFACEVSLVPVAEKCGRCEFEYNYVRRRIEVSKLNCLMT